MLSRQTLEAIGTLVAVAIERARAIEQLGLTEAAREGERLRTALLDSVTHALRTPLTSIKASVTNLLSNSSVTDRQRQELLTIINEETDRLNRLVGEAGEMARLDAGEVELELEPRPIEDVIAAALSKCKTRARRSRRECKRAARPAARSRGSFARPRSSRPSARKRESIFARGPAHHHHRGS